MNLQKSMTGYGRAEVVVNDKKMIVEIRTLNGKGLDLSVKMPALYRKEEPTVRKMIGERVVRGKCDVFVSCESGVKQNANTINSQLFEYYLNQLESVCGTNGIDVRSPEIVTAILRMPDIFSAESIDTTDQEIQAILSATAMAVEALDEFRSKEGAVLLKDVEQRIDNIAALKANIAPFIPERLATVQQRLKEGIEKLSVTIDENRFEQELIYYIEKYDITEEMVRLDAHLQHFHDICSGEPMCGKKLGFMTQEIGREINTTGSKANHVEIQKIVIEMKDELEKIKEQVLNLM